MKKVFVIGLDGVPPELVFEEWGNELPNLNILRREGIYGPLESIVPPITVPAWASMLTSLDPGELGIYGFRNRTSYSTYKLGITTSYSIKTPTLLESLINRRAVALGIPPSYPPKPINGVRISCFLTPDTRSDYTYPKQLKISLEEKFGEYLFDVRNFRTNHKERLLKDTWRMTQQRFEMVKYLLKKENWSVFWFVEMGPDRIHHGFWKFFDKKHRFYEENNPYEKKALEYYRFLDAKIGEVIELLDDKTTIFVVSDHGAKKLDGCIALNEWLIQTGYLKLNSSISKPQRISPRDIDWERTVAWGEGGYYGRVFINLKGREKNGKVEKNDYEKVREELKERIESIPDEKGKEIGTVAHYPEELYRKTGNTPPDLIVIFGNLHWRSVGSVGIGSIHTFENDTGPDDANHSENGMFMIAGAGVNHSGKRKAHLYDIAPTISSILELKDFPTNPNGECIL